MNTETLKISLAQKILSTSDTTLLKKVKELLEKEKIIGYDAKDNPIFETDFINEIDISINEIENGTATLFTTEEVRKNIVDAYNLE